MSTIAAVVCALALVACGGGSSSSSSSGGATPTKAATAAAGTCGPAGSGIAGVPRSGTRTFSAPPQRVIDPTKTYVVTMNTSKGTITLELAAADAPNTVNNFVFLSCDGFYDGLTFHRVVPDPPVIQGGDPAGNGTGGPGYGIANEISPKLNHDTAGIISMAHSSLPNSNGSQFFITTGPAAFLDGQYSAFGHVTGGMDVVNAIRQGDRILSVSIQER